jgi:hypothetical protein
VATLQRAYKNTNEKEVLREFSRVTRDRFCTLALEVIHESFLPASPPVSPEEAGSIE